jgi:nucleotide-binding universal stress UspA family protein
MRILYATDGSAGALAGADLLNRLALGADDRILVVSADPQGKGEAALPPTLARLSGSAAAVETVLRIGEPAAEILHAAAEARADLILVGAMGRTGLAHFLVGSVAERVLRHASLPVLMARPVRHSLRRALVGLDASAVAERVAATAAEFPLPPETELRLVTVLPPVEAVAGVAPLVWESLAGEMERIMQDAMREAEDRLRRLAPPIRAKRSGVSAEVIHGEPAASLLGAVDQEEADFLMIGSHGEGNVDRFLLGSVSERAARHAHCSVLVVR